MRKGHGKSYIKSNDGGRILVLTQHQLNTRRRMREHGTHIGMQNHILPCTTAYWAHTALTPQCEYTLGRNLTNVLIAIRIPRIRWTRNCTQDTKIGAWDCGNSLVLGVNVNIAMNRVPFNYFHIAQFGTFRHKNVHCYNWGVCQQC